MQSPSLIKLMWLGAVISIVCIFPSSLVAQTGADAQASEPQSWTKTTESNVANTNPTRTTESHQKSAKGTVDHQSVERLGADGHYEPYYDVEKESVQVNATTVRTIERTFARDANGQRILTQVTEEDKQGLPSGGEKVVRTTSNADLDGHLQVAQREVTNTKKISPEVQEKNTTVFLSDGQGGMAASVQIQQREKRNADHTVEVQSSTLTMNNYRNTIIISRVNRIDPMTSFDHPDRLRRFSKAMAMLTTLGMLLIAAAMIAVFLIPDWTRNLLLARLGQAGHGLSLSPGHLIAAAAITAVPVGVLLFGLWQVRALFLNFVDGHVFTLASARLLRDFAGSVLAQAILGPISSTALMHRVHAEQSAGQSPARYHPVGARLSGADCRRRAAGGRLGHGGSHPDRR